MFITLGEIYETTQFNQYDIDIEDYKTWLEGDKPTEDNLLSYIIEKELNPILSIEGNSSCVDSYVDDASELFKAIDNEN